MKNDTFPLPAAPAGSLPAATARSGALRRALARSGVLWHALTGVLWHALTACIRLLTYLLTHLLAYRFYLFYAWFFLFVCVRRFCGGRRPVFDGTPIPTQSLAPLFSELLASGRSVGIGVPLFTGRLPPHNRQRLAPSRSRMRCPNDRGRENFTDLVSYLLTY